MGLGVARRRVEACWGVLLRAGAESAKRLVAAGQVLRRSEERLMRMVYREWAGWVRSGAGVSAMRSQGGMQRQGGLGRWFACWGRLAWQRRRAGEHGAASAVRRSLRVLGASLWGWSAVASARASLRRAGGRAERRGKIGALRRVWKAWWSGCGCGSDSIVLRLAVWGAARRSAERRRLAFVAWRDAARRRVTFHREGSLFAPKAVSELAKAAFGGWSGEAGGRACLRRAAEKAVSRRSERLLVDAVVGWLRVCRGSHLAERLLSYNNLQKI